MKSTLIFTKRTWLYALVLCCLAAAAVMVSPCVQKAHASYDPINKSYKVVSTYNPSTYMGDNLKVLSERAVRVCGTYFWSDSSSVEVPDTLQIWRTDPSDNSSKRNLVLASESLDGIGQYSIDFIDEKLIPGKTNYEYAIVGVKESTAELSLIARWTGIGGTSYAPDAIRATKISGNKAWVYVTTSGLTVKKTTVSIYAGSKKVKSFKPTRAKTYKFVIKGKKIAKKKFKATARLKGDSSAKAMSTEAVKAKANVWKTNAKPWLIDCLSFSHGVRIMKVYCKGGKLYTDVWFYNTWRYTAQKDISRTVKVRLNGKLIGKKKVRLAQLKPKSSKWKKKVCLGKKTVDLVNGGTLLVG